jgi:hypothetical protein
VFRVGSSTGTTIVGPSLSLTDEAAPPKGARIQAVGFQGASGDLVADGAAKTIASTSLDFTTLGLTVGEWLKPSNFAITVANNGWSRLSAIAENTLTFDIVPSGWGDDAGTSATIKVFWGDYIRNGVSEHSYSIERQYTDHDPVEYEVFRGMEVDQTTFTFDAQAVMKGQMTFMGKDAVISETRTSGATDIAAPTNSVLNTSSNVGQIAEGGSPVVGPNFVMNSEIVIANNLRARTAIGTVGAVSIGAGECSVTGKLNTYFGDRTLYEKVLDNSQTSYSIRVSRSDAHNQTLLVDLPRMKFSDGSPDVPGKNQDVMAELSFQAFMHETLGYTIAIQRFSYVE